MILSHALKQMESRRKKLILLTGLSRLLALDLLLLFAGFGLDNLSGFGTGTREVLRIGWIAVQLSAGGWIFWRIRRRRTSDRERACALEHLLGIRDNILINAVCFQSDPKLPDALKTHFLQHAEQSLQAVHPPPLRTDRNLRQAGKILLLALIPLLLYTVCFPRYAWNAMSRYLRPGAETAALNFIRFDVKPGDVRIPYGGDLTICASAWKDGKQVTDVRLLVKSASTRPVLYALSNGSHTLKNITAELTYAPVAEGETGREYRIVPIRPPSPEDLRAELQVPAYTGLPDHGADLLKTPVLTIPEGTRITVTSKTKGLKLKGLKETPAELPLRVEPAIPGPLSLSLTRGGETYENIWTGELKIRRDAPPLVQFLNEKTNLEAGYGEIIPIHLSLKDDYGVSVLKLTAESERKETLLREYRYSAPGLQTGRETFLLRITPALLPQNGVLELKALVTDGKGQTSESPRNITIHQVDLTERLKEMTRIDPEGRCYAKLMDALNIQQTVRDRISLVLKHFPRHQAVRLLQDQRQVDARMSEALSEAKAVRLPAKFIRSIELLKKKDSEILLRNSAELVRHLSDLKANEIVLAQTSFIEKLRKLLGIFALYERKKETARERAKEIESEKALFESMRNLKEKLDEFRKEQKKVKVETEALDPKKAEDFTEAEEKLLGSLTAKEDEWSNFFKAAFSDLSKKYDQDFSNSAMADEFVELYEELQKAGEALKAKKIEIATLAEDTALDSANAASANIERWLADKKDYIKWTAEEDGKIQDTDLTDLPAELTDIIGDLIEQEDEMTDDTSDSSNSFAYDSDEALGWGVSDGNIDSMQAKGITGNVMPNNNEVGGRSGEGRSGRSSGQFVEKEATGKGGRKTPTRLQQSPFEKGTVNDRSKDGQGGATGGGKQSGVGGEGLAGTTPDQDPATGKRTGGKEAELHQRTAAMLKRLEERNLPTGDLREALQKIQASEQLGEGGGVEAKRLRREAALSMRRARASVDSALQTEREIRRKRKKDAFPVKYPHREKVPASYEDLVGEYFKALAIEEETE